MIKIPGIIRGPLEKIANAIGDRAKMPELPNSSDMFASIRERMPTMGYAGKLYHEACIWILTHQVYGLASRIKNEDAIKAVEGIAELHRAAIEKGKVPDDEWKLAALKAEHELSAIADMNLQVPSMDVIKATTGTITLEKLQVACDALILVIAHTMSQSSASAGASAISRPIPIDPVREIVFKKVKSYFGG